MKISTKLIFLISFVITFQNYQFLFAQVTEQKILPGDGAAEDYFGNSVSISGDYTIVGAHLNDDNGTQSGSAYIFRKDGANWIEEQKLLPSDGAEVDLFGYSVSISGDYTIVSADHDSVSGEDSGSAYIFRRNGTNWIEEQKLVASDGAAGDRFGTSVAISGNYAIVGAYLSGGNDQGAAYIFRRDSTNWIEEKKLIASDADATDIFGLAVSISGNYAIVGAHSNDDNGSNSGSAYIFRRNGTNWIEVQKLLPSDGAEGDAFGISVSILGDYAIVGRGGNNPRTAYIFRRNGTNWIEEKKLVASDAGIGGSFGNSVSISGDYTIVSDRHDDDNGTNSGSAYIFRKDGTNWIEVQKLLPNDGADDDFFGHSVSISGDYVLIGAIGDDDNGSKSGSVYIYSGISSLVPIDLTRPNGGENFIVGSNETILWDSYNITDIKIEYSINNGASWILVINSTPAAEGNYLWKVPNTISAQSKVRISESGNPNIFDISEDVFTISPAPIPVINLLYPNGGEQLFHGDTLTISWSIQHIDNIKIEFSQDNGFNWLSILDSIPASNNQQQWIIPDSITSDQCLIRICDINNLQICDKSASVFSIEQFQEITILTPNGGEVWPQGITEEIFWTSENVIDVKIELSIDNGANWTVVVDSTPSTGIYSWLVNATQSSTQCLIKISDVTDENTSDESDDVFTIGIVPAVNKEFSGIPESYKLLQNYPNPFNPSTTIYYGLPEESSVEITIYDVLGNEVMVYSEKKQEAGFHKMEFDATGLPSGIYFYQLRAGSFAETKKMVLMK